MARVTGEVQVFVMRDYTGRTVGARHHFPVNFEWPDDDVDDARSSGRLGHVGR